MEKLEISTQQDNSGPRAVSGMVSLIQGYEKILSELHKNGSNCFVSGFRVFAMNLTSN